MSRTHAIMWYCPNHSRSCDATTVATTCPWGSKEMSMVFHADPQEARDIPKVLPHLHLCHMRTNGPGAEEHRFLQCFPPWIRFRMPNVILSFSQQSDVTLVHSKHWHGAENLRDSQQLQQRGAVCHSHCRLHSHLPKLSASLQPPRANLVCKLNASASRRNPSGNPHLPWLGRVHQQSALLGKMREDALQEDWHKEGKHPLHWNSGIALEAKHRAPPQHQLLKLHGTNLHSSRCEELWQVPST